MKLSLVIVLHLEPQCLHSFGRQSGPSGIWNDFKSNHKISNQIQIKSHLFQIKSLFFKSNHYAWFDHDLNQIMIWICPSLDWWYDETSDMIANHQSDNEILNKVHEENCDIPRLKSVTTMKCRLKHTSPTILPARRCSKICNVTSQLLALE